jgi:hypothetical protein
MDYTTITVGIIGGIVLFVMVFTPRPQIVGLEAYLTSAFLVLSSLFCFSFAYATSRMR